MQLVILAGGKGTRLGLKDIPKPMRIIGDKPLLEHQIELAKRYGIDEIFILTSFLGHVISDYFGTGSKWGIKINCVQEKEPRGTAGSLLLIKDKLKKKFLVFYGDIMMDFDIASFIEFDKNQTSVASIVVHPNSHPFDSDLVEINEKFQVLRILSKPHPKNSVYRNLVNAAIFIISPIVLDYIREDIPQDFGKDILPALLKKGKHVSAYYSAEYFKDMGTPERLMQVEGDYKNRRIARLNKRNQRPAIFIDRDGVMCQDMDTSPRAKDLKMLPKVIQAIKLINDSDYLCVVVTNQPMIAKGFVTLEEIELTHKTMEAQLGNEACYVDRIYYCPHHPEKGYIGEVSKLKIDCDCRKPKPGMLFKAASDLNIDLKESWMVGDRDVDMIAGKNAGCRTIQVGNITNPSVYSDYQLFDLFEAVNFILRSK